jgi:hypothetical protein
MTSEKDVKLLTEALLSAVKHIHHWHDWGKNNEGMVVGSEHVRNLWQAASDLEQAVAGASSLGDTPPEGDALLKRGVVDNLTNAIHEARALAGDSPSTEVKP